ncbi:MAG: tetratricopeptide repeat protein [bacterium]|nr:tetratricopeptide repeat protein [bacterium]
MKRDLLIEGRTEPQDPDPDESRGRARTRKWERTVLGFIIAAVLVINLDWIRQDQDRMLLPECYTFLAKAVEFVDQLDVHGFADFRSSLDKLSIEGRPPLYMLLTVPCILLFGRSEDAALSINMFFGVVLMISTYHMGRLTKNRKAGLLGAFLVASYPPMVYFSRAYLPHFAVPACVALSLWLLLSTLKRRSIKIAWLFGASLAFGLLIHPMFAWSLAIPTAVFGVYMLLFQTAPKRPAAFKHTPGWLFAKLRDRFVTLGLFPAALISLGPTLSWYLVKGSLLFELMHRLSAPELAKFRGVPARALGFPGVEPSFWWHARTAPGAISNVLALFVILGLVSAIIRRRLPAWVLIITLIAAYTGLSLLEIQAWMYFIAVLPVAACLTAAWIAGLRHRWLAGTLTVVALAVAAFDLSVVSWGVQPWSQPLAVALGSPMSDNRTCQARAAGAFCPAPPRTSAEIGRWPLRAIQRTILDDPECRQERACSLMFVQDRRAIWIPRFKYYLTLDRRQDRLRIAYQGVRTVAQPYSLGGLLNSDYVLYPDLQYPGSHRSSYLVASVRFLKTPPLAFADAHQAVGTFEYPNGEVKLVKRTKPLTAAEAEASIAALELDREYKSQRFDVLAPLYVADGNLEKTLILYEEVRRQSPNTRSHAVVARCLADIYRSRGQLEQAIVFYREALAISPRELWLRFRLVEAYRLTGNSDGVKAELETAMALAPDSPLPRLMLARYHESRGEKERAVDLFQQVLELVPDHAGAQQALARLRPASGGH